MRLKWSKSYENLKKMKRLDFQKFVYLLAKSQYFFVIVLQMVKMEFTFKHATLITKV